MALMAFAETETKMIKTLQPIDQSRHEKVSWQREDTLLQQHRRHNTGELPNAHAHSAIEHCQGDCKNGEISRFERRHFEVHDGIGHAKPPQLGVGIHHDSRYLLCQRGEVIQSLLYLFRWKTRKALHPHAMNSGRFTWCSWSMRKNSLSGPLQQRKTSHDGTQRTNIMVADTLLSQHRVRPSSIKLKSFHFTSATAVGGSPRSGATSLCVMALDGPNFHVWSKRQKCCSGPLLLNSWVSASISAIGRLRKVMASRERRWGLSFLVRRALQGWKPRTTLQLNMAPKFSIDRHVRHRTTISEWHRCHTEWVRHTFHEWMQTRASRHWQTLQFLSRIAPHARSDHHTRGEACILMQAETERVAMRQSTRFFHYLFLDSFCFEITMWKSEFSELLWKILSSFVQDSFSGDLFLSWKSCPSLHLAEKLFYHLLLVIFEKSHS